MKRATYLLALTAFSIPVAQADSTLLPTPVAAQAAPVKAAPEPEAEQPKTEAAPTGTKQEGGEAVVKPENADAEAKPEGAEQTDAGGLQNEKTTDTSRRLRERLASVDVELSTLSKPTRGLQRRVETLKSSIESNLERVDRLSLEVATIQDRLNNTINKNYEFTIVKGDMRDKYVRDAKAAHQAMIIDMNERKSGRKIKGLDKFEILRDRYQGIPEYKEASAWYNKTLADLEKKWSKMKAAEELRREKLQPAKRDKTREDDEKDIAKLEKQLKAAGDDIAKVWYVPSSRNLAMLNNCLNKVHDVQRRMKSNSGDSKENKEQDYIGNVPPLLNMFWENMDKARSQLVSGDWEGADETLNNDPAFPRMLRLPRNVMPDEYRDPMREQRKDLQDEIKARRRDSQSAKRSLENKIADLERTTRNLEARIDAVLEDIDRVKAVDAGENTANLKQSMKEDHEEQLAKQAKEAKAAEEAKKAEAAKKAAEAGQRPAQPEATPAPAENAAAPQAK